VRSSESSPRLTERSTDAVLKLDAELSAAFVEENGDLLERYWEARDATGVRESFRRCIAALERWAPAGARFG
jgi:hypothetical protein